MTDKSDGKIIIFDIANTLVTFRADLRTERLTALCDLPADELNAKLFTAPDSPGMQFDRGLIVSSEFYDTCCGIMGVEPTEEFAAKFRHAYQDIFEPRPEVGELVRELAVAHELWLMSNTNVWHLDYVRSHFDYFSCFTTNCNSCDTAHIKPEREIFEAAIERSGRPASDLIFIDDRQDNVDSAQALGINALLYTSVDDLKSQLGELTTAVSL